MDTSVPPATDFSGILRERESYSVDDDNSVGNQINGWFDRLMLQSGWAISPELVLLLSAFCAIVLGGAVFVWQENLIATALAAVLGFMVPFGYALYSRGQRQRQVSEQLPPMIDELARAAKTGRSLEQCLQVVATDTPSPLGTEMQFCTRKLQLGLNIEESLSDLPRRTGVMSTSLLLTALGVHRQTGGDLVRVLERLAQTLRDRLQFQGRLRAATAASRATAILMIALPPVILAFFIFRDPNYLTDLMATTWGMRSLVTAFILEIVGSLLVWRILSNSANTN
ncbi:MAG: type II secretion system F family protein [Planctomycetaceae bacterium]|nr:type II secretion system F family protein [Planctomycetaceae bacterium]